MKNKYYLIIIAIIFLSCKPNNEIGNFKLLPHPKEWKIAGNSELKSSDLEFYYNPEGIELPPGSDFLGDIKATENKSNAQLVYSIDPELDLKEQGYLMDVF